jgi:hypothetical protein
MSQKRIPIGSRPVSELLEEGWIKQRDTEPAAPSLRDLYPARLTVDVSKALRGRIKMAAYRQGVTVADTLRALLEREYPETPNNS